MWDCIKDCITSHLPQLGWLSVGLIVAGIIAAAVGGVLTGGALLAIIGVVVGTVVLTRLIACLAYCGIKVVISAVSSD